MLSRPPRRWSRIAAAVLGALALAAGIFFGLRALSDDDGSQAPAPQVASSGEQQRAIAAQQLGFPGFATKNTTRIGGIDSAAVAAGAALATYPSQGGLKGPPAVSLVASDDWAAGIAASVLMSDPIGAPVLISDPDDIPDVTSTALVALGPEGSSETSDAQAFAIGQVATPGNLRVAHVEGASSAELAASVEELRHRLTNSAPDHIVLATSDDPGFAMPAAAWAARSGDPVLFVGRDSAPTATLDTLKRYKNVPVYALGPSAAISDKVLKDVRKVAPDVTRIAGDDPVDNAIAFARYDDGDFGWGIIDPGHGMVIANVGRPMDAAAASPLSGSGTWGPLLLTETAEVVPASLRGFLLDIKPGYVDDPTRAFYNHAWIIGDAKALSVGFQAQVDELLELTPIQEGAGSVGFGKPPTKREKSP